MEGSSSENNDNNNNNGGGGVGGSRWNPTKEQISMLENLYKQGIRTPTAEQIQQITARLRTFGHIEGKNVFYWFQNHKARQRQKQKQESFAFFNRFHHHIPPPHPLFPPPLCPNVICRPYYVPHSEMGFVGQHPKVLLPAGTGISSRRMPTRNNNCFEVYQQMQDTSSVIMSDDHHHQGHFMMRNNKETLQLFPLQPTGFLEDKTTNSFPVDAATTTSPSVPPPHHHHNIDHEDNSIPPGNQPFFDFLSSPSQ